MIQNSGIIQHRTFQVLQNGYWITSLFESIPMDKVKQMVFMFEKVGEGYPRLGPFLIGKNSSQNKLSELVPLERKSKTQY